MSSVRVALPPWRVGVPTPRTSCLGRGRFPVPTRSRVRAVETIWLRIGVPASFESNLLPPSKLLPPSREDLGFRRNRRGATVGTTVGTTAGTIAATALRVDAEAVPSWLHTRQPSSSGTLTVLLALWLDARPNTFKNCASDAGCAGHAGAVTKSPSICALPSRAPARRDRSKQSASPRRGNVARFRVLVC